jgi:cell fate (sporulation/competence/biofilm development) regulator YlbF (YheA/YmcA/DUF963 family)
MLPGVACRQTTASPRGLEVDFAGGATLRFGGHPLSCVGCPPRTFRPAGHQTIERMSTLTNATAITDKTRELCQIILDHPIFQTAQARIQAFVANDQARTQYETLVDKGQELRHRQHHGETLGEAEVRAFETEREALLRNPVARGFVDAQSELHELQHAIEQQVALTFKLGRLPTPEDLANQSCGDGCSCHHH